MRACSGCGGQVEASFRFCPWCAAPQRRKLTELFAGHPELPADRGRALRVSRYVAADALRHVRLSIWGGNESTRRAEAALSLDEAEAERLAAFLLLDAEAEAEAAYGEDTQPSILG
jgi:hypothetical protein